MKKHKGLILAILALAQFIVVLDGSIVNVALASIKEALNFSAENLQWVVTAYTLAFGGFLLLGGRASDLFGRRKTFLAGLVGFTAGSMLVGASQSEAMVIVSRAIQGLAAAFMSPAALSIILTEFKEGSERNKALGIWGAIGAGGAAAGALIGGALTQFFDWRWDFFVNVPIGIALVFLTLKFIPSYKSTADHKHLDILGALFVTGGLMSLVYGLTKAPDWGWGSIETVSFIFGALILLALFVINELRSKHPLVPMAIFRNRNLSGANLVQLPIAGAMISMFFFVSLYLQDVLHYEPLQAGLCFLPFALFVGLIANIASRLVAKVGYKPFMVGAPLITATGIYMLSHVSVDGGYWSHIFPGLSVMALGVGMTFIAVSIAATSGVKAENSGLASGLLNTSQQLGGAIGLAILSGIAADSAKNAVIHDGMNVMAATVHGYDVALVVCSFFAIAASIISLLVIKQQVEGAE